MFNCPQCGRKSVSYDNANHSSCSNCGNIIPNAHLPIVYSEKDIQKLKQESGD